MMMTLDEGIEYCEKIADECEEDASMYDLTDDFESYMASKAKKCASDFNQLASWLKALKEIWDSGACNDCNFSGHCEIQPKVGQLVRFNCYHFSKRGGKR